VQGGRGAGHLGSLPLTFCTLIQSVLREIAYGIVVRTRFYRRG